MKNRLFAPQASDALTCVAGVKRGGGREGKGEFGRAKARGARERDRESTPPSHVVSRPNSLSFRTPAT